MKALEFTTTINEGIIHVPEDMKSYNNTTVRVLILADESENNGSNKEKIIMAINEMKKVNMFSEIDNPTQWQKKLRNEWE